LDETVFFIKHYSIITKVLIGSWLGKMGGKVIMKVGIICKDVLEKKASERGRKTTTAKRNTRVSVKLSGSREKKDYPNTALETGRFAPCQISDLSLSYRKAPS
jgi:hypothetical protein